MKVFLLVLLIMTLFISGCIENTPKNQDLEKFYNNPTQSQREFLTYIKYNNNDTKIMTWWDFGKAINVYGSTNNVLNFISEEGCLLSVGDINICKPPFESHQKVQDVSKFFFSINETESLCIAKKYGATNVVVSKDMMDKSIWWTFFATQASNSEGNKYSYLSVPLQKDPVVSNNSIIYFYPFSEQQAFVLYENLSSVRAFLQQNNQLIPVENVFYFTNAGGVLITDESAYVKGMLWLTPDKSTAVFMPKEIENSMFTRLFFFNGQGLNNFEYINSWGGEIKYFKILYPKDLNC